MKACFESEVVTVEVRTRVGSPRHFFFFFFAFAWTLVALTETQAILRGYLFAILRGSLASLSKASEFGVGLFGNISILPAPQVECLPPLSTPVPLGQWCWKSG